MPKKLRWLNIPGILVILILLVAWELAVVSGALQMEYLPAPTKIIAAMGELFANGELSSATLHTLFVVLQAWAIAVILGALFGMLLGQSRVLQWFFGSSVDVLRSLPISALVPVVILILGLTRESEVFVGIFGAIWPMLVTVAASVQRIPPRLSDVATTFGMSAPARLWKITLPSLIPSMLVGARLAMGLALVLVVVTEMLGNPQGLGAGLVRWQLALRPDAMWAYLFTVAILGFILNWILVRVGALVVSSREARS